jgi:hypothetical protein
MHAKRAFSTRISVRRYMRQAALRFAAMMCIAAPLTAQRPAPPKSWTIDTTAGKPVGVRRGGMMSTDTRVELLGPVERDATPLNDWLRDFAQRNAATIGSVVMPAKDTVAVSAIGGQQVAVAAYAVTTAAGNKYLSYSVLQSVPNGSPVIVVRTTFGDALTLMRVYKSSVEAVMPYVIAPMASMRNAETVALAPRAVTSLRAPSGQASGAQPATTTEVPVTAGADSAVSVGVNDAIAMLDSVNNASASPRSTTTTRGTRRAPSTTPSTTPSEPRTASTTATSGPGMARAQDVQRVVFYQWGDLQYHPVVLFKDGTTFDLDDEPIEQVHIARSKAADPNKWGRWRNQGATYFLTSGGNGTTSDYQLGGGGLYTAVPAPALTTLNANYKSVSGSSMGEMSTLLTSTLRFLPDGRFTSGSDFAAVGNGQTSGVTMAGGSSNANAGRYRINGYTIELRYNSGQVKSYFFAFSTSGAAAALDRDMIFIGDTAYITDN